MKDTMTTEFITAAGRDIPTPDRTPETAPYWEGAARGELWVRRCASCNKAHHYPRSICPFCFHADTRWERAGGGGTIYSYSAVLRAPVPYVIAYVTLDEGPTMMTNIVECDPARLSAGQRVEMVACPSKDGSPVPMFRPVR